MTSIAMWSGPRNISTAMMYSFGNRADCIAWDEPFYAFSLVHHGNDHPMRDDIVAANSSDFDQLVGACLAAPAKPVFYQKHMTHHMLHGLRPRLDRQTHQRLPDPRSGPGASELHEEMGGCHPSRHRLCRAVRKSSIGWLTSWAALQPSSMLTMCWKIRASFLRRFAPPAAFPSMKRCSTGPRGPSPSTAPGRPTGTMRSGPRPASASRRRLESKLPPALQKIADEAQPYYDRLKAYRLTWHEPR